MIKVEHVKKKFIKEISKHEKKEFYAVNDISFTAKEGEILGILGPNGAGKTTLLRMIAGIMTPNSGTINYDNLDFQNNEIEIKKELAYLSGNTKIYDTLSPYELMMMSLEFYDYQGDKERRIKEISEALDLNAFLYNRISKLSTGQTQRTNIARCLVHNPNYYIFDEATSGLDIMASEEILKFIRKERENGKCIIYSTHYMEEAENICDRIIMINKGKVIASGTPEEIKEQTKTTNLRASFFALIGGSDNE